MTLSIIKISKRRRNFNYDYIIIRKNYEIVDTIGILYYRIKVGGQDRKVFSINLLKIKKWLLYTNLIIPKWFNKFLVVLRNVSFDSKLYCEVQDIQSQVGLKSHLNDLVKLKKKHLPFYRFKIFTRHFLNLRNSKNYKLKTNVRLYNKKI